MQRRGLQRGIRMCSEFKRRPGARRRPFTFLRVPHPSPMYAPNTVWTLAPPWVHTQPAAGKARPIAVTHY
jgi:hypothetical protein